MRTLTKILCVLCVLILSGCATVTMVAPDGTKVSYTRIGNQEIGKLRYNPDTKDISLDNQRSNNDKALDALNTLIEKIPTIK